MGSKEANFGHPPPKLACITQLTTSNDFNMVGVLSKDAKPNGAEQQQFSFLLIYSFSLVAMTQTFGYGNRIPIGDNGMPEYHQSQESLSNEIVICEEEFFSMPQWFVTTFLTAQVGKPR
jgi:hypothetical protein